MGQVSELHMQIHREVFALRLLNAPKKLKIFTCFTLCIVVHVNCAKAGQVSKLHMQIHREVFALRVLNIPKKIITFISNLICVSRFLKCVVEFNI